MQSEPKDTKLTSLPLIFRIIESAVIQLSRMKQSTDKYKKNFEDIIAIETKSQYIKLNLYLHDLLKSL